MISWLYIFFACSMILCVGFLANTVYFKGMKDAMGYIGKDLENFRHEIESEIVYEECRIMENAKAWLKLKKMKKQYQEEFAKTVTANINVGDVNFLEYLEKMKGPEIKRFVVRNCRFFDTGRLR